MTIDKSALKALAEACKDALPLRYMESPKGTLSIRNDYGIVFGVHQNRSFPKIMKSNKLYADLVLAASPATILSLLAEIHSLECRLEVSEDTLGVIRGCLKAAEGDIDQLKAENESLKRERADWQAECQKERRK